MCKGDIDIFEYWQLDIIGSQLQRRYKNSYLDDSI